MSLKWGSLNEPELERVPLSSNSSAGTFLPRNFAAFTHPGGRDSNQDALGVVSCGSCSYAVLADGAGGHAGGQYAAQFLVSEALRRLTLCAPSGPAQLHALTVDLNEDLLVRQGLEPNCADMHSTLLIVCVRQQSPFFLWCHCGDSRLYHINPQGVQWHTRDHSLLQSWKDRGLHGELPVQANALYSAMGEPSETLQIDVGCMDTPAPQGSLFLLASDGFWGAMDEANLYPQLTATHSSLQESLTRYGLMLSQRAGPGADNLSAITWAV